MFIYKRPTYFTVQNEADACKSQRPSIQKPFEMDLAEMFNILFTFH